MQDSQIPHFGTIPDNTKVRERPSAYALIFDDDGQLAIVETPSGIHLPGGGVDGGESHEDAAIRETREETGLDIEITGTVGRANQYVHRRIHRDHVLKISVFYTARVVRADSAWSEPDHELQWVDPEDVVSAFFHESHAWAVKQVLNHD